MQCDCAKYGYNEEIYIRKSYWKFKQDIFMGKVYECPYCGALWVEYMTGHGWTIYYKQKLELIPEKKTTNSIKQSQNEYMDEKMKTKWKNIVNSLPAKANYKYGHVVIPADIMTVLVYLFENIKNVNKWLFTTRNSITEFEIPIKLIEQNNGEDKIRSILLKYKF